MRYLVAVMWCWAAELTVTWARAEGVAEQPAAKVLAEAQATDNP